ncbi:polysaccharide biosynthesis protein GumF, partial [Xanthomonas perforans]
MSVSAMPASPSALPAADAQVATGGPGLDPRIDVPEAI